MSNYLDLLEYCSTERQEEYVIEVDKHGGYAQAARHLGISESVVRQSIKKIKARAASKGYSPEHNYTRKVPDPFVVKGISTYYDKDGNPTAQWVKSGIDWGEYREVLKEQVDLFYSDLPEIKVPKFEGKKDIETDIIPWFQIGDAHLGMLSHEMEVGSNFDLKIAVTELMAAFNILYSECKHGERCVINDLGDFTHYENFGGKTDHSGHDLDYDTRFSKMIKFYIPLMRFIVESALKKFKYVDIIINQGNHSRTNDIWMSLFLAHVYKKSDRVTVLDNTNVFIPYKMGKTFVMTHHSDKCKPNKLAHVMATDYSKEWGESEFRYIDIGHIHHAMVLKEHPGVRIESFNCLATKDKYAHDGGWRSRQSITRVDRSKTYGEVGRRTLPLEQVRDYIRNGLQKSVKGYKIKEPVKVHSV